MIVEQLFWICCDSLYGVLVLNLFRTVVDSTEEMSNAIVLRTYFEHMRLRFVLLFSAVWCILSKPFVHGHNLLLWLILFNDWYMFYVLTNGLVSIMDGQEKRRLCLLLQRSWPLHAGAQVKDQLPSQSPGPARVKPGLTTTRRTDLESITR